MDSPRNVKKNDEGTTVYEFGAPDSEYATVAEYVDKHSDYNSWILLASYGSLEKTLGTLSDFAVNNTSGNFPDLAAVLKTNPQLQIDTPWASLLVITVKGNSPVIPEHVTG